MKVHRILALLLAVFILLNGNALAMSQEEWDQRSRVKTSGTATLYDIELDPNATDPDLSVQLKKSVHFLMGPMSFQMNLTMI